MEKHIEYIRRDRAIYARSGSAFTLEKVYPSINAAKKWVRQNALGKVRVYDSTEHKELVK